MNPNLLLLLLTTACGGALGAQAAWTKINPASAPAGRSSFAGVWDAKKNEAMFFGGELASKAITDEMWTWDGKTFARVTPATLPPRRSGNAMAFDLLSGETVLFSGWNGASYLADTWVWDGAAWTNKAPATMPPPRDWHQMVHVLGQGTLLFGGHDYRRHANNGPGAFGDTWMWNGTTWTQLQPATDPGKRFGHVMAFDKSRGAVVMLGGSTPGTTYDDMWEWTGTDWREIKPAHLPGPRVFATMAWDDSRGRLVLHGGQVGGNIVDDVWEWDGFDWNERTTAQSPAMSFAQMIYDPSRKGCVLVGGAIGNNRNTPSADVWSYASSNHASFHPFGSGCRGAAGTPSLTGSYPWTGETMTMTVGDLPAAGPAFLVLGLSRTTWGATPLPLDLSVIGAPGCSLLVAMNLQLPLTVSNGTGSLSVPVPNTASLVGVPFYNQAYAADRSANAAGLVVSNAAEAVAGNR